MKEYKRVKIGLYSAGLQTYWAQFEGLKERLDGYNAFLAEKLSAVGDVYNFGFVDTEAKGSAAGEYFRENGVDIIFAHSATYFTSSCILPVHQTCCVPVVFLNLQPTAEMNYAASGTGEWLAHCVACPIPEVSNAFERAGITTYFINGLLGLEETPAIHARKRCTHGKKYKNGSLLRKSGKTSPAAGSDFWAAIIAACSICTVILR